MMRLIWGMLCIAVLFLQACDSAPDTKPDPVFLSLEGKTMGTTYKVIYLDSLNRNFQSSIDSALIQLNLEVSTYIDSSSISRFNQSFEPFDLGINLEMLQSAEEDLPNSHFLRNLLSSYEVYRETGAAFDPTIMPLVNYWGFGYTEKKPVAESDSLVIDSLLKLVGLDKMVLEGSVLHKEPGMQLDFSAVAKGYGVDMVGALLESRNVSNYFVEIGGEVRTRGLNSRGTAWQIGVSTPQPDAPLDAIELVLSLSNQAMATSGNYRNFYEVEGRRYAHTINPKTGYPELNTLLSATVVAETCMYADALATGFMVMGPEAALELAERLEGVECLLIVGVENGEAELRKTTGFDFD